VVSTQATQDERKILKVLEKYRQTDGANLRTVWLETNLEAAEFKKAWDGALLKRLVTGQLNVDEITGTINGTAFITDEGRAERHRESSTEHPSPLDRLRDLTDDELKNAVLSGIDALGSTGALTGSNQVKALFEALVERIDRLDRKLGYIRTS
jgi:hypothetical protein